MNATSLNNLWNYIQGLTLSASNKKWLADHLRESMQADNVLSSNADSKKLVITKEDLELTPLVASIGETLNPIPNDCDDDSVVAEYLTEKYK